MTAFLVEQHPKAYAQLSTIQTRFLDIEIKTYPDDFISVVPRIVADIPRNAFAFFFIDPKGWRIPLLKLQPMLARANSEVTFNFMFEFINRAASMTAPDTVAGLGELMPHGNWRARLAEAERDAGRPLTPDERKDILIGAFTENLQQMRLPLRGANRNLAAPEEPDPLLPLLRHAARAWPSGISRMPDQGTGCTG
jgi:three-Cys-motif partner protein